MKTGVCGVRGPCLFMDLRAKKEGKREKESGEKVKKGEEKWKGVESSIVTEEDYRRRDTPIVTEYYVCSGRSYGIWERAGG